jgi:glycosyltransferase involved in cell wall biosynthesis
VPLLKSIARRVIKYVLKRADSIIVPTIQVQEIVKNYKINKATYLLPTGIDTSLFNYNELEVADFRGTMEQMYLPLRDRRILL